MHRVDDRYFFEVPDSLMRRDFLMVTRVSGVPAGSGGFQSAGSSVNERMVRWHRANDRVILQVMTPTAVADDSLPIAKSVADNNYAPILGAFPIAAFARDSNAYVIDVTDFFAGDNPATSGLERRRAAQYQRAPLRSGAQLRQQRARLSRSTSKCGRCRRSTPRRRRAIATAAPCRSRRASR